MFVKISPKDSTKSMPKRYYRRAKALVTKRTDEESKLKETLSEMCTRLIGVCHGCIILVLKCDNRYAVDEVWKLYKDGMLNILINEELQKRSDVPEGEVVVEIEENDYKICQEELNHLGKSISLHVTYQ